MYMNLKCLKCWRTKRPGMIWSHPRGAARILIQRGFAEAVMPADDSDNSDDTAGYVKRKRKK